MLLYRIRSICFLLTQVRDGVQRNSVTIIITIIINIVSVVLFRCSIFCGCQLSHMILHMYVFFSSCITLLFCWCCCCCEVFTRKTFFFATLLYFTHKTAKNKSYSLGDDNAVEWDGAEIFAESKRSEISENLPHGKQ